MLCAKGHERGGGKGQGAVSGCGGSSGGILRPGGTGVGSPGGNGRGGAGRSALGRAVSNGAAGVGRLLLAGVRCTLDVVEHGAERVTVLVRAGSRGTSALLGAAARNGRSQRRSQIHAFHDAVPAGTMRRMEVRLECCSHASRIWMVLPGTGASMALPLPR